MGFLYTYLKDNYWITNIQFSFPKGLIDLLFKDFKHFN